MEFRAFAERASTIEATDADLEVVSLTADLLAAAEDDLPVVARFVQGRIFPAWTSRTLDIGPSLCYEALARAAEPNVDAAEVENRLAEVGDVGEVAAGLDLGGQTGLDAFAAGGAEGASDGRTVGEVYEALDELASADGAGSQDRKTDVLFGLFSDSSPVEARYLARLVLGEMRIGVGEGAVRDATAEAFDVPTEAVARALQVTNDYGLVAERARDGGAAALEDLSLDVGRPVQAMLAQAGTVTEALEDWHEAVVETKLDGARVQVHYAEDDVELFSRNMEAVTAALPEIVDFVEDHCRQPAILDGEVVAVDDAGDPLPFQEVLRRFRRKHDVQAAREDVATELHVFDCLHAPAELRDEVDVPAPPSETTDAEASTETADAEASTEIADAETSTETADTESSADPDSSTDADESDESQEGPDAGQTGLTTFAGGESHGARQDVSGLGASEGSEDGPSEYGDAIDLLDAPLRERRAYLEAVIDDGVVPSQVTDDPDAIEAHEQDALAAGHEGIMLKNPEAAYTPGRRGKDWLKRKPDVETLDLVVTGAEWGEGRRASLFGTFLLSARTDDGYAEVGKVATGITDEELADLHERVADHVESERGQTVDVEPAVVFEVGYEEIQRSPTYDAGYALRFPRFVAVREDLDADDADSLERVERLAEQ